MVFETCRTEGDIILSKGWSNTSRPCFLGICCLYGAAVQLGRLQVQVHRLKVEAWEELKYALNNFSARWRIGGKWLSDAVDLKMVAVF